MSLSAKFLRRALITVTAILLTNACTSPPETSAHDAERLQALVEQLQTESGIPGLSVAIAAGDGPTLTAAAGLADRDQGIPVIPDTMFFLGSVAKNIFATTALRLVDRGQLDLDSPLADYLQWPRGDEVTIRSLLNHTSGIPEYMTGQMFEAADDGGIPEFFRVPRNPAELLATIPEHTLIFDPGSRQGYSNSNGLLVGEVLRRIAGRPLADILDQEIVLPLGLERMYLFGESTSHRRRARGYSGSASWGAVEGGLVDCSSADEALPDTADGSVVAAAGDLLRYHQALRRGELLSDDSWTAMSTIQPGFHNGLGYLITEGPFGRVEGNLGRSMGHTAANLYYLDLDAYVVILSNRSDVPLPLEPLLKAWFPGEAP